MLGFHTINNKNIEIKEINKNKIDEPFPDIPHIFLLENTDIFHIYYRQTEGIPQGYAKGKVSPN
ncbi:MAG TPA: hypothetical protein VIY08_10880 [Candidatus Nitrosocosmicus sp.]